MNLKKISFVHIQRLEKKKNKARDLLQLMEEQKQIKN